MKRIICTLLALLLVFGVFTSAFAAETDTKTIALQSSLPFTDVNTGNWFYSYVAAMYTSDIMMGTGATTFAPQETFSRAQVIATLFRIHHGRTASTSDPRDSGFADVSTGNWFAPYATWARQNAIVVGTTFGGNQGALRQEIALFMHRYIAHLTNFSSQSSSNAQWEAFVDLGQITEQEAYMALRWASNRDIVRGIVHDGVSRIAPTETATRAEAATMLSRLLDNVTGWPAPQRVNIAELLDVRLSDAQHMFGHLLGTVPGVWAETYRFRSGILVGVDENGLIASLQVDFLRVRPSIVFHYNELGLNATRQDVRAALGDPTFSDGTSYAYWLSGEVFYGPVLFFAFDSHNNDRVSAMQLSHAV